MEPAEVACLEEAVKTWKDNDYSGQDLSIRERRLMAKEILRLRTALRAVYEVRRSYAVRSLRDVASMLQWGSAGFVADSETSGMLNAAAERLFKSEGPPI